MCKERGAGRWQSNRAAGGLVLAILCAAPLLAGAARGPTLQLFPTTVLEDIKETGQVAEQMETGLQDVIARLDRQQQLYVQSKCDGAEEDPGCARIARQLGATYMEMLDVMSSRLPDMERAVNSTRESLEKRLRAACSIRGLPRSGGFLAGGDRGQGLAGRAARGVELCPAARPSLAAPRRSGF